VSESKMEKGKATLGKLLAGHKSGARLPKNFGRMTMEHLFGDVWQGEELEIEERSLITCTVLVALGREAEQRIHFRGARNLGIPREKIEAVLTHVAHYAGWPAAVSGFRILDEVWTAMDAE
jgi:4-carboxymuconolactone decarboxylase